MSANIIRAPGALSALYSNPRRCSVFLAGSIDQDRAERWQERIENALADYDIIVLNPRRESWDATLKQAKNETQFEEQVEWELEALEQCSFILLHLTSASVAPISLLELGLFARSEKMVVSCEAGFWRRGNVEIVCNRYKIPCYAHLDDSLAEIISKIS